MQRVLLAVLVFAGIQDPTPTLEGIPDSWPTRERTAAQRFGMKTIENIPVPELDAGPGDQRNVRLESSFKTRNLHRVFGVRVRNPGTTALSAKVLLPKLEMEQEVVVPAGDWTKAFFAVPEDPKRTSVLVELWRNGTKLASAEIALGAARTGTRWQAALLVDEFRREMEFRAKWPRFPVRIETSEPEMDLTFLHKALGLRVTAKTSPERAWAGTLLGGEWTVYARKEIRRTGIKTPSEQGKSSVEEREAIDLYYFGGTITAGVADARLRLAPERHAPIRCFDTKDAPLMPERIAVTPSDVGPALRYQLAHEAASSDFILRCRAPNLEPTLHSTANLSFEIQAWAKPAETERVLYLEPRVAPEKAVELRVKGKDPARLRFEPASLAGCDRIASTISMPDAAREVYSIDTKAPMSVYVPAGLVRVAVRVHAGESVYHFTPEAPKLAANESVDLSPRDLQVFPHWCEYRGLQVWACVMDSRERFITRLEKAEGKLKMALGGKTIHEDKIDPLTWHFPDQFKDIAWSGIQYTMSIKVGSEFYRNASPRALVRKQFSDPPASVIAPEKMLARAKAVLPMMNKTLAMCLERFGFAKLDQALDLMIRMPPELGALAGGDRIIIEISSVMNFAHETDTFDRVYPHELGHNLGFGHDTYMAIAYHGCDEGLLGWPGYLLQVGTAPQALLKWLDRDSDGGEWSPGGDLFASMRLMYGPLVHKRMFEARKKFEKRLVEAGFSVEERIMSYYSFATDLNLAWMARAHGWPVFDYRVNLALAAMKDQSVAGEFKIATKLDGTFLTTWWMRGPIRMKNGAAESIPAWGMHTWPGRFLRLADEDTVHLELAYHMYLTLGSEASRTAFLCISTDSQVDVYLDGQRVTRVFAAPQKTQPAHDDYTLGRMQGTRVPLYLHEGANAVELVVVKPSGSKGMFIELAGQNGKPVPGIGHALDYGPEDRTKADGEKVNHPLIPAVNNGSFEGTKGVPDAWIMASKDGDGNVIATLDDKIKVHGERSLKLELDGPVRGNVIQRCIVDEEADYELTGFLRTEGFKEGDVAFVMLFWGQPEEGTGFQHGEIFTRSEEWKRFKVKWKADRRAVYVGCVLRGGAGAKAWFDNVQLTRLR